VVNTELERLKIDDINNVQTLILYNIGDAQLTIGELTNRGYYLGSNVSYNVKKLVESGYLIQEPAPHDKRSTRVKLSDKGMDLCKKIDAMHQRSCEAIQQHFPELKNLEGINNSLKSIERFWTDYINHLYKAA
jgi:DNA-binding MarR family transcriptional regulator